MPGPAFAFPGILIDHRDNNLYPDGAAYIAIGLLMMRVARILASRTRGLCSGAWTLTPTISRAYGSAGSWILKSGAAPHTIHGPAQSARENGDVFRCRYYGRADAGSDPLHSSRPAQRVLETNLNIIEVGSLPQYLVG